MEKIIRDLIVLDRYYLKQNKDELKYLMVMSQNQELKKIVDNLLEMDEIYRKISLKRSINLISKTSKFDFNFEELISDKVKYKEYYDKRISGRDLRIFLTHTIYYLEKLREGDLIDLRKQYKQHYKVRHIPYGLSIAIKYLKYLKV